MRMAGPSPSHACPSGATTLPAAKKGTFTIQQIRELELEELNVEEHYQVIKEIGSGDYGKVILGHHRRTRHEVALKAVPKMTTPLKDFLTEFHYSYFLSPHPAILDTYDVAFETAEHYFFAQEVAHMGDLWNVLEKTNGSGLEEREVKVVCEQIASALDFMHEKELVHRDVRAENILIFSTDLRKVKLTDFGLTRRAGTLVTKRTRSLPTCPPEIWEAVKLERYTVELGSDCWQMGMLIFALLTTRFPWERADIVDPRFRDYVDWQKRKTTRTPKEFRRFTPRLLRLFRRYMEVKPTKRYPIMEVHKYMKDRWLMQRSPRTSSVLKLNMPEQLNFNGSHNLAPPSFQPVAQTPMIGSHMGIGRSLSCSHLAGVGTEADVAAQNANAMAPPGQHPLYQSHPHGHHPQPLQFAQHVIVGRGESDPLTASSTPPIHPGTGYGPPFPQQYQQPYNMPPQQGPYAGQQQMQPQQLLPQQMYAPGGIMSSPTPVLPPSRSPRPQRRQTVYHSSTSRGERNYDY